MRVIHWTAHKVTRFGFAILFIATAIAGIMGVTSTAHANPAGFLGGNVFQFTTAIGDVSVTCFSSGGIPPSGPMSAQYRCNGYVFSPAEYAHFVGPMVDADQVELVSLRQDGSTFSKTSAYDPSIGRSTDSFNLWVETVFQRPLLKAGRNDIRWTLIRRGNVVASGNFFADVTRGRSLFCPGVSRTSWDMNDCRASSRVCQDYFYDFGDQCR